MASSIASAPPLPPTSAPRTAAQRQLDPTTAPTYPAPSSLNRKSSLEILPNIPALQAMDRPAVRRSRTGEFTSQVNGERKVHRPSHPILIALNDTPATTAPNSPAIPPRQRNSSADRAGRQRATTLDIPGLTKSAVSPDGRIAQHDIGSKLVIIMVGLPARGKSYITKKLARYLNWLQHDTRIFNVGERRRVVASGKRGTPAYYTSTQAQNDLPAANGAKVLTSRALHHQKAVDQTTLAAQILLNDECAIEASPEPSAALNGIPVPELQLPEPFEGGAVQAVAQNNGTGESLDQSAAFFDPTNQRAASIRDQCALDTLDELLHYILDDGGSVGILDATNSTLERRKMLIQKIRERAGIHLNVLFCESLCLDEALLERNMMLKLSGPDYKDKDPVASLMDFKKRVEMYQKSYIPLGEYEEKNNMSYVQMIDVGRKVISHQINGFLSAQAVYYLLNFNLAPRQIWITRHGESEDNVSGKLGGDAALTEAGRRYARALTMFLTNERKAWEMREITKAHNAQASPIPGTSTPPNPHYAADVEKHILDKNFCVWTSMLKRSVETAQYFNEEDFDVKQMRMLDELNAGNYEGLTYEQIKKWHREQFDLRRQDKLQYRYPGPGGEGYLDVVNRLRPVIVELERMTDHCLLIGHRSVARILLAYFKGLDRSMVPDLDVPLGVLWCLEPKPYGVALHAYQYNAQTETFNYVPDYELKRASSTS